MTNICAAIGVAQMTTIDNILVRKRLIAQWYKKKDLTTKFEFH